ncbi:MAG: Dyp-type peroxidase [Deltaproteobacteria bacterium]|nr:MAG: Dyp-type peroxidase [Deltaproteobacteria bacterium]
MNFVQRGILADPPPLARHLFFACQPAGDFAKALLALQPLADGDRVVVGVGKSLVLALGREIPGLRIFPALAGAGIDVPSTPFALWCWLRGEDRGELLHGTRAIRSAVAPAFRLDRVIDAFRYGAGLDLTGYEDGTENPKGDAAKETAILSGGAGLAGSSFVAVQQWVHDLDRFEGMGRTMQDHTIGRRREDNVELDDAPESAHVKRTAQEDFAPPAFLLRRSMPWADARGEGLVFVAFARDFSPFEAQLRKMLGLEDGVTDALFRFSRPVSGSYFWCPPMGKDARLDLTRLLS